MNNNEELLNKDVKSTAELSDDELNNTAAGERDSGNGADSFLMKGNCEFYEGSGFGMWKTCFNCDRNSSNNPFVVNCNLGEN